MGMHGRVYVRMTCEARACLHVSEKERHELRDSAAQQRTAESHRCAGRCSASEQRATTRSVSLRKKLISVERSNLLKPFLGLANTSAYCNCGIVLVLVDRSEVICVIRVARTNLREQPGSGAEVKGLSGRAEKDRTSSSRCCAQILGAAAHWDRLVEG